MHYLRYAKLTKKQQWGTRGSRTPRGPRGRDKYLLERWFAFWGLKIRERFEVGPTLFRLGSEMASVGGEKRRQSSASNAGKGAPCWFSRISPMFCGVKNKRYIINTFINNLRLKQYVIRIFVRNNKLNQSIFYKKRSSKSKNFTQHIDSSSIFVWPEQLW